MPKPRELVEAEPNLRVNWEKRDSDIAQMSKKEIQRILRADKPERVTTGRIGKNLCLLPIIEQHLDKLPQTRRLLDDLTETIEDFQIRRAKTVVEHLILQNEPVKLWIVFRKAGLGLKCSENVRRKIIKIITLLTKKDDETTRTARSKA